MKAYCCGFLFKDDFSEVMLVEKRRPAWQNGLLNGIGGHIEENETPYAAMVREFKEEAGVEVLRWMLIRIERHGHNEGRQNPENTMQRVNVYFFAAAATSAQWQHARSITDEKVIRMRIDPYPSVWKGMIYNLEYLIPMGKVLLRQPLQNIPLP